MDYKIRKLKTVGLRQGAPAVVPGVVPTGAAQDRHRHRGIRRADRGRGVHLLAGPGRPDGSARPGDPRARIHLGEKSAGLVQRARWPVVDHRQGSTRQGGLIARAGFIASFSSIDGEDPFPSQEKRSRPMTIRPLSDRILVKRVAEQQKTAGGLHIPDSAKEKPLEAMIVAVGSGKVQDDGVAPGTDRQDRRQGPAGEVLRQRDCRRRHRASDPARGRRPRGD